MSIFRKLKDIFSAKEEENTAPQPVSEEIDEPEEPAETPVVDENKLAEARRREEALLDALSALHIAQNDTQTSSFLLMHSYRFEAPFSRLDLHNMVNGLRWHGFRLYSFSVHVAGEEIDCESWQSFVRHLAESDVGSVTMLTSFGGVRVNVLIDAEGSVHFSHDSSRGVDFSPFESLFDPEEIEPEEE